MTESVARISIIIPVLNEAATIRAAIDSTLPSRNVEVIVVDGGSRDATRQIAQRQGVQVITSAAGRAHQMNVGAQAATGEILLFLHGDTRLPAGFDQLIRAALQNPQATAGAFRLRINAPQRRFRWVEWGVDCRSALFHMPYGDQAIFLRRSVFQALGGFAELPIMEDFELMRRLRPLGLIVMIKANVITSARRWQRRGIVKTTLINQLMILGYGLGVSPERLAQLYRNRRSPT
jgi:rSAM/selenodomain-associated transferase 2